MVSSAPGAALLIVARICSNFFWISPGKPAIYSSTLFALVVIIMISIFYLTGWQKKCLIAGMGIWTGYKIDNLHCLIKLGSKEKYQSM
jgi:hypothetical protein